MFEKSQEAITKLSVAVTEDLNSAVAIARAAVVPAIAGVFSSVSNVALNAKQSVESGDIFKPVSPGATKPDHVAPLPTEEQNTAIKAMKALNMDDKTIAQVLNISPLTVKMSY